MISFPILPESQGKVRQEEKKKLKSVLKVFQMQAWS